MKAEIIDGKIRKKEGNYSKSIGIDELIKVLISRGVISLADLDD